MNELKVKDLIELLLELNEEEQNASVYLWFGREKIGFNIEGLIIEKDLNPECENPLSLRIDIDKD